MTGDYDPLLVLLSLIVAVLAASVALDLAARVVASRGRRTARYWLAGGAVSMGTGIWTMHFIGMLALRMPVAMSYDVGITLLSLLVAVLASGFALRIISRSTLGLGMLLGAGALMGLAIAGMHYLGMAAMEVHAPIRYRPLLVAASIAIAIVASVFALRTAFALRAETMFSAFGRKAGSAAAMGLAISGMHYVGMAAAVLPPVMLHPTADQGLDATMLAVIVGCFTLLLLATTLVLSMVDAHFAVRAAGHVRDLRQVNAALASQAAELAQANTQLHDEVEERMRSEARASYVAAHDALTALPNRARFSELLQQSLVTNAGGRRSLAVMFIDLDRFKEINDTLGHAAGDALLIEIARRLRGCIGAGDRVARLGGDEFVILVPDVDDPERIAAVADAMLATLVEPYATLGQEFHVTASIGISRHPADGEDERTLMRHADVAMYRAKADGKNRYRFYHPAMDEHALARLTLETSLRHAIERDEFLLHYQPKVDAASGRIVGVEALLRWRHPAQGVVLPGAFLALAEETGLVVPIGRWVLRTACRQHAAWRAQGLPAVGMSVNLSARQFADDHLLRDVVDILSDTGMDPTLLELEVSERTLMQHVDRAIDTLSGLAHVGVRIAIDGFGTGYAALSTLGGFRIHTIKIDRAALAGRRDPGSGHAVTDAIMAMGRALGSNVIAEGVETREQADFLRARACDQLQGFHFREAMPADEVGALLHAEASRAPPSAVDDLEVD